ncbi:MAG: TRAP transporter substrate-binding protein [Rhodospirillales bacterium]|nr:TRAP transporter substrate-binding protein [Rhodospirillales bacterium]
MKKTILTTMAGCVVAAAYAAPASAETKWMYDVWIPLKHPIKTGFQDKFQEDVARVTNGRVKILFPASRLSSSNKQWEAVEKGISDVAVTYIGWYRNRIILPSLAHLPFMVPNAEKASVAIWRTSQKFFRNSGEFKGMKLLAFVTHNGSQIANSKREIKTLADLKGLKIRVSAGEATQVMKLLGGNPVATSGPKIFEYVSKGVVDGISDGMHAPLAFKIIRYLKYVTQIPGSLGTITFSLIINEKKWNGISKADQKAIVDVTGEKLSAYGGKKWDDFTYKSIGVMKKDGVSFKPPSAKLLADIKKRLQPMQDTWIKNAASKGVDGKAAIAYYRSQAFN